MFLGNWELNLAFFLQPFWYNLINQLVTHIQNLIYQSHGYFISFREYLTNTERSSNTLKDEMCLKLWAVMKYFLLLEILWQIKNLSLKLPRALTPGQIKSETYATFIKITIVYSWWACYNEGVSCDKELNTQPFYLIQGRVYFLSLHHLFTHNRSIRRYIFVCKLCWLVILMTNKRTCWM